MSVAGPEETTPPPRLVYAHLLVCPRCREKLSDLNQGLGCKSCGQYYPVEENIPRCFVPNDVNQMDDVTGTVKAFYEENPFPNYEETDDLAGFTQRARKSVFAQLLDQQIPFGARVLECGCGTGQLSNFLGIAHRTVFGTDICLNSLRLAQGFKMKTELQNVYFLQMNLFRPVFSEASFDVVICNGVLHSTVDPYLGFQSLVRLVKPGGHLIIGLYHRFGRLLTDLRRIIFRLTGDRFTFMDPRLRRGVLGRDKWASWMADQYKHPHELKYTIGEILRWLPPNGLELVKTIPKTRFGSPFRPQEQLFDSEPAGHPLVRNLIEWKMALRDDGEGGFFTVISRRKS